jgi:hypothetical protein
MRDRRGRDLRILNTSKKIYSQEMLRVFNLECMALRRSIIYYIIIADKVVDWHRDRSHRVLLPCSLEGCPLIRF